MMNRVMFLLLLNLTIIFVLLFASALSLTHYQIGVCWEPLLYWTISQWMLIPEIKDSFQQYAWGYWENIARNENNHRFDVDMKESTTSLAAAVEELILEIPIVSVQDFKEDYSLLLNYLELTYGTNWRDRPLLLRGIWNSTTLKQQSVKSKNGRNNNNNSEQRLEHHHHQQQQQERRLSLSGLLKENLTIPYFHDATIPNSLTPDSEAPIQQIVQRIQMGYPHKIGTQLLVQTYPELINEVAPNELVTTLFGNHFQPYHLVGSSYSYRQQQRQDTSYIVVDDDNDDDGSNTTTTTLNERFFRFISTILPGSTTVPVFIANSNIETTTAKEMETNDFDNDEDNKYNTADEKSKQEHNDKIPKDRSTSNPDEKQQQQTCSSSSTCMNNNSVSSMSADEEMLKSSNRKPQTGLHCEPIGNIAVQLSGSKQWTLIDPKYSYQLEPSLAPDGRAFYASWLPNYDHIPRYIVSTNAGDAIWVPTWTWHRVDYIRSSRSSNNNDNCHNDINDDAAAITITKTSSNNEEKNNHCNIGNDNDDDTDEIAIGGSLFHFRPFDFVRHNPLYALLILPALVKEILGISTQ